MAAKEFVMVGEDRFEFNPGDLVINKDAIKKHLSDQASQFYNVSFWAGKAKALVESLAADLKILEAELDANIRKTFEEVKEKVTEGKIRAAVLGSEEYRSLTSQLQVAQAAFYTIQALQGAFGQRKDCVIELARHLRAEMDISGPLKV